MMVIVATLSGCAEKEASSTMLSLKGKIEKIERSSERTGTITVLYYNEKQGKEVSGSAIVTTDTEIMINGALAKLADLRDGDRVKGKVRVDKKDGLKTQTVLKLRVTRAERSTEKDG